MPLYKRHTPPRRTRVCSLSLSLSLSCVALSLWSHVSLSFSLVHLSVHVSLSLVVSRLSCAFSSLSRFPSSQPLYIGVAASRAFAPPPVSAAFSRLLAADASHPPPRVCHLPLSWPPPHLVATTSSFPCATATQSAVGPQSTTTSCARCLAAFFARAPFWPQSGFRRSELSRRVSNHRRLRRASSRLLRLSEPLPRHSPNCASTRPSPFADSLVRENDFVDLRAGTFGATNRLGIPYQLPPSALCFGSWPRLLASASNLGCLPRLPTSAACLGSLPRLHASTAFRTTGSSYSDA